MRLIDADELKKVLAEYKSIRNFNMNYDGLLAELIDNAPTVEEVSTIEFKEPLPPVKAQKIIRALNKRSQGEWISVSERLPEFTGLYLISVDDVVTVANFTGTYFMHRGGGRVKAYAWQPLPEPYKKGGSEMEVKKDD